VVVVSFSSEDDANPCVGHLLPLVLLQLRLLLLAFPMAGRCPHAAHSGWFLRQIWPVRTLAAAAAAAHPFAGARALSQP
jgi:hypothetical protein